MKKVSAARSPNRAEAAVGPDGRGTAHVVKSPFWRKVWHFVMVFGPGLIVMEADNDAGAVSTYTQAGAQYGLHLLWTLLLLLPVTYFAQEMVVRLGIATGRGHADMIYKRFGKWWGRFSLLDLQLVNFFTLVTEFAAIALVSRTIGLAASYSVPIAAALAITLVVTGGYLRREHIVTNDGHRVDRLGSQDPFHRGRHHPQHCRSKRASRRSVRAADLPGHRHRWDHDRAMATVLSAKLRRGQETAVSGFGV
jgi:hypothetical protein